MRQYRIRLRNRLRKMYRLNRKKRLKNPNPTIIVNNCIGGIIYSDLNLEFTSPTIDVLFGHMGNDFFKFLDHLEYYAACDMEQIFPDGCNYPVGQMKREGEEVNIHFVHDTSFEDAREKWTRRCERMDLDNVYVIFETGDLITEEHAQYQLFKKIPFPHKRLLTTGPLVNDPEIVDCKIHGDGYVPGTILLYPSRFSWKRHLDVFDYVSFFNEK